MVFDALIACGATPDAITVRDARSGLMMLGQIVAVPEIVPEMRGQLFHVAVGPTMIRERLHHAALAAEARPRTILHPNATVSPHASFGEGVFVAARAIVAVNAQIGDATIVNHGAIVDHDCRVGSFCHIAPGATLGGGTHIGDRVMIGSGAVVLPGVSITGSVTIGAGTIVLESITEPGTWVGNPARKLVK